jgi:hypothetical protein
MIGDDLPALRLALSISLFSGDSMAQLRHWLSVRRVWPFIFHVHVVL